MSPEFHGPPSHPEAFDDPDARVITVPLIPHAKCGGCGAPLRPRAQRIVDAGTQMVVVCCGACGVTVGVLPPPNGLI